MTSFHTREMRRCPCGKPATVEVFNDRNSSFGVFCTGCARRKLADLRRAEAGRLSGS